jgi:hypothetical protein
MPAGVLVNNVTHCVELMGCVDFRSFAMLQWKSGDVSGD